jgi:uncharacterized membrane protein YdjX (TVP38/TMEM64 family)
MVRELGKIARHILFWTVILAVILIPFFVFGHKIEAWTSTLMEENTVARPMAALLLGGLLASDILMPIPSSLASTACGYLLGIVLGTLVSFIGMTISSIAGYWLGRKPGSFAFSKSMGEREARKLSDLNKKFGRWLIVIARPVPVLAEASVFFAGVSHMPFKTFMVLVSLSNLGISAVYAVVGSLSADMNTFMIAFGASMGLPLVFMVISAVLTKVRSGQPSTD